MGTPPHNPCTLTPGPASTCLAALGAPPSRASPPRPSGILPGLAPPHPNPDVRLHPQLSEKATLGPAVRPLPWQRVDRDVNPGTLCDVAGWGIVSHAGRRPDRLQHVLLPVLDRATCNRRTHHDGAITERMMCAESNRRDSCKVSLQRNGRAWEETRDPHDGGRSCRGGGKRQASRHPSPALLHSGLCTATWKRRRGTRTKAALWQLGPQPPARTTMLCPSPALDTPGIHRAPRTCE
ncbi:PREDICTED: complement factor D [Colobus angolensis palliatus]|uniref:complement factor D n=1 Tax=Colobus angolensis palliatus TaxID=336983 RepID=UPI0005F49212|nr:PREDICTED: complement factor D [Colobus angolensis palliatus]